MHLLIYTNKKREKEDHILSGRKGAVHIFAEMLLYSYTGLTGYSFPEICPFLPIHVYCR